MKPRLAISFSGGRSSAVMTKLCLDKYRDTHEIVVAFANTGLEHPATLDFVKACDENWSFGVVWLEAVVDPQPGVGVRHKVVNYETASRNGEPFEAVIAKYGIPNATTPMCTTRLKENVLDSYREGELGWRKGTYQTAVGIRADEIDRISEAAIKRGFVYPLLEAGYTKEMVDAVMRKQPWDLKLPGDHCGNCVTCWKKSDRKLYTLALENPAYFDFFARMEREYGHVKTEDYAATAPDGRRYFFRGHRSTAQILHEARTKPFEPYRDSRQFTIWDELLDLGGACSESCEIGADEEVAA